MPRSVSSGVKMMPMPEKNCAAFFASSYVAHVAGSVDEARGPFVEYGTFVSLPPTFSAFQTTHRFSFLSFVFIYGKRPSTAPRSVRDVIEGLLLDTNANC